MSPIAPCLQISKKDALFKSDFHARQSARYFAAHKSLSADRRLVIKENSVTRIHFIRFAIVDSHPVCEQLRYSIGRARIKWGGLSLRSFLHLAKQFGTRSLIEADVVRNSQGSNCIEKAQRAKRVHIGSVFRTFKRNSNVALCRQIVDFMGLNDLQNAHETVRVCHIAIMQTESNIRFMWILVKMIDTIGVEKRAASLDSMYFIALLEKELRKIGSVLTRDTRN